jgi:hypothetical protein
LADSVEKNRVFRTAQALAAKNAFFASSYAESEPEFSAQSKDFNLKRVLFCRGNHGRLFQHNRPKTVGYGAKLSQFLKAA